MSAHQTGVVDPTKRSRRRMGRRAQLRFELQLQVGLLLGVAAGRVNQYLGDVI